MPRYWELALPNEVSLRELSHLVTIGCSGYSELTLGLNPMPSLAFVLRHSWNRRVSWPANGVGEVEPFQAEKSGPDTSGLGSGNRCSRLHPGLGFMG